MLQTEYVRSLNCNYERILLENKPEEKRYQYCILSRGGIKGLLSSSLRYINGQAYLYYDISSKQNIAQLYGSRPIAREWMKDFIWGLRRIRQELERFLLDIRNVVWYPQQIFQELESNAFSFLYIPYYEGEASFIKLVEFWVEHIDYDDEVLVDYVYRMYEQVERNGEAYLDSQIFEDAACLEKLPEQKEAERIPVAGQVEGIEVKAEYGEQEAEALPQEENTVCADKEQGAAREEKKGLLGIFEGRRNKNRKLKSDYKQAMQRAMTSYAAEESTYEQEEYGQTIFLEEKAEDQQPRIHRLYTAEGRILATIDKPVLSIGKKKGEVDVVLEDVSVSRMHARITAEKEDVYLEDMNSTNGTFKNGLRLQPYEKRKLETEDEIKCGKVCMVFR